jgi:hypothetical protein
MNGTPLKNVMSLLACKKKEKNVIQICVLNDKNHSSIWYTVNCIKKLPLGFVFEKPAVGGMGKKKKKKKKKNLF